jgi:hypothetical protein
MKLPLFVTATPAASLSSPSVLLKKGHWRLISNQKSSSVELRSKSQSFLIQDGVELEVTEEFLLVWAFIITKGDEKSLSVSLETVRKDARIDSNPQGS